VRVESVRIGAFGPFVSQQLEFAPGLCAIIGPNEAGKSTWHAAVYAAICGVPGAQAQPCPEDYEFARRHRPWDRDSWIVTAVLRLEDGRRVEIRHDLDGREDSRAVDLGSGQDVSDEIRREGSLDGSRWLGLDRRTFLATACVRQADILSILENAEALQEHLQRAAATGGTDASAAAALELLQAFHRENVGQDRVNSSRPLRQARERLDRAREALELARQAQAGFLDRVERADCLEGEARAATSRRLLFEAAAAGRRAEEWARRLERARELAGRQASRPGGGAAEGEALALRVSAALQALDGAPLSTPLEGPEADELATQLAALPAPPEGDIQPDQAVLRAKTRWDGAGHALQAHDRSRPAEPTPAKTAVPLDKLQDLRRELEGESSAGLPEPDRSLLPPWLLVTYGGAIALLGGAAIGVGYGMAGTIAAGAGGVVSVGGIVGLVRRARGPAPEVRRAAESAARRKRQAADRARQLGLPAEPPALRQLTEQVAGAARQRQLVEDWTAVREVHVEQLEAAAKELEQALGAQDVAAGTDLDSAFNDYLRACRRRAETLRAAARRGDLERQLSQRRGLEDNAVVAARKHAAAAEQLREMAAACEVSGDDDEALVRGLHDWQERRAARLEEAAAEIREQGELATLLGDGSIEDLEATVERHRQRAQELAQELAQQLAEGVGAEELGAVELGADSEAELRELREAEAATARQAGTAKGELTALGQAVLSVAAAEEELVSAQAELERIAALGETIVLTRQFLEQARERVHRDMAPVLAGTLRSWLPRVTAGRYEDTLVEPETLAVKVCGQERVWREARLLSQGAREQVYLLLRLAMVEHLTRRGEVCPLILDDVTVQSDAQRTAAILELLHEVSQNRQVILLSQEDDVREWAESNLTGPRDRLRLLQGPAVPA
jgi:DNA repair exonuclease SbcCD ATPase subunit